MSENPTLKVSKTKLEGILKQQGKSRATLIKTGKLTEPTLGRIWKGWNSSENTVSRLEEVLGLNRLDFLETTSEIDAPGDTDNTDAVGLTFRATLAAAFRVSPTEDSLRAHVRKLAGKAIANSDDRNGIVTQAINAICCAMDEAHRKADISEGQAGCDKVNDLAQSLAMEVLARMIRWPEDMRPTAHDGKPIATHQISLTALAVLLQGVSRNGADDRGGVIEIVLRNAAADHPDKIVDYPGLKEIRLVPGGTATLNSDAVFWALDEETYGIPPGEGEKLDPYDEDRLDLLSERLNYQLTGLQNAPGLRKVVGLYYHDSDKEGGARNLLANIKGRLGRIPVVHMYGRDFCGEYLLKPSLIAAKISSIWLKCFPATGVADKTPTHPPSTPPHTVEPSVKISITNVNGNDNATK